MNIGAPRTTLYLLQEGRQGRAISDETTLGALLTPMSGAFPEKLNSANGTIETQLPVELVVLPQRCHGLNTHLSLVLEGTNHENDHL